MSNLTVKRTTQTLTAKRGSPTTLRVRSIESRTVSVKPSGLRGPPGERGEQGPPGPIGNLDNMDLPDFTLLFDNALV